MSPINLRDVPEVELRSPGGRFRSFARNVSLALGGGVAAVPAIEHAVLSPCLMRRGLA